MTAEAHVPSVRPMRRPEASATVAVGPVHFFLDETGFDDRSRFAAIACAILDDPPAVREEIRTQRARLLREPFLLDARAARVLAKKGFHYSTDPMEVKLRFIEFLMGLTFEAYVCFVEKPVPFDGRCCLDKLFGRLLFDGERSELPGGQVHDLHDVVTANLVVQLLVEKQKLVGRKLLNPLLAKK